MFGNILDSVRRDLIKGAVITSITETDIPRPQHPKQLPSDSLPTEPPNTSLLPSGPLSSSPIPSELLPSASLPAEQLPTVPIQPVTLPSESLLLDPLPSYHVSSDPPQQSLCHANHTPLNLPVSNRVQ